MPGAGDNGGLPLAPCALHPPIRGSHPPPPSLHTHSHLRLERPDPGDVDYLEATLGREARRLGGGAVARERPAGGGGGSGGGSAPARLRVTLPPAD
jgi:hypothetical protein